MKKLLKSLALSLISVGAVIAISGCGGSVKDAINDTFKNGLFGENEFNKTIADNSSVDLSINVDTEYTTLLKIAYISLSLKHSRMGDLKIVLTSPSGTSVVLSNYRGGNKSVDTIYFKDDTSKTILNYNSSTVEYRPEEPLSNFNGENPKGIWHLKIVDSVHNSKTGYITGYVFMINGEK